MAQLHVNVLPDLAVLTPLPLPSIPRCTVPAAACAVSTPLATPPSTQRVPRTRRSAPRGKRLATPHGSPAATPTVPVRKKRKCVADTTPSQRPLATTPAAADIPEKAVVQVDHATRSAGVDTEPAAATLSPTDPTSLSYRQLVLEYKRVQRQLAEFQTVLSHSTRFAMVKTFKTAPGWYAWDDFVVAKAVDPNYVSCKFAVGTTQLDLLVPFVAHASYLVKKYSVVRKCIYKIKYHFADATIVPYSKIVVKYTQIRTQLGSMLHITLWTLHSHCNVDLATVWRQLCNANPQRDIDLMVLNKH